MPGDGRTWFHDEDFFGGIGTHWLEGGGDHDVRLYLEWRTGRVVVGSAGEGDDPPPRDLDSPKLRRLPRYSVGAFGRYTLFQPGKSLFPSLVLRRSGRRSRTLDGCYPGGCKFASIGLTAVAWVRANLVHVYLLKSGKRMRWTFRPQVLYSDEPLLPAVTANRIFFNVPLGLGFSDGYRVDTARLPR